MEETQQQPVTYLLFANATCVSKLIAKTNVFDIETFTVGGGGRRNKTK
jgi:hypothetical protein